MLVEAESREATADDELLNEPQRRRLEVFLELLEQSLNEVERIAARPDPQVSPGRIVYETDIPANFRDRSSPVITRLRHETERLAQSLNIPRRPRSRLNTIRAILTAEIVRVEDTFSDKLGGYGAVNSRVRSEVDPRLSEIRSDLKELLAALDPDS